MDDVLAGIQSVDDPNVTITGLENGTEHRVSIQAYRKLGVHPVLGDPIMPGALPIHAYSMPLAAPGSLTVTRVMNRDPDLIYRPGWPLLPPGSELPDLPWLPPDDAIITKQALEISWDPVVGAPSHGGYEVAFHPGNRAPTGWHPLLLIGEATTFVVAGVDPGLTISIRAVVQVQDDSVVKGPYATNGAAPGVITNPSPAPSPAPSPSPPGYQPPPDQGPPGTNPPSPPEDSEPRDKPEESSPPEEPAEPPDFPGGPPDGEPPPDYQPPPGLPDPPPDDRPGMFRFRAHGGPRAI